MRERLGRAVSTLIEQVLGRREPVPGSPEARRAYIQKINRAFEAAGVEPYGGQLVPEGRRDLARALMD